MPPNTGKKNGHVLPPKPSTVSEEQWELAHSASKLLELLATPESSRGTSASKAEHAKPLTNKQTAALWLWQLVSTSSEARDEANKAGAVEISAKLVGAHSSSATSRSSIITSSTPGSQETLQAYCLGTLTQLAAPSAGSQSAAVREALLTVRPLVLPALLSHIAEASSTSLIAAALGLLAVLTGCPDTHGKAKKIMAGWNKRPLIKALTMQHSLPLDGGRHAAADAAAVLQAICSPTPPTDAAAAAAAGGGGKEGSSNKDGKGAKDSGSAGKSSGSAAAASANPAEAAAEASLTAAVQDSVLAAGGLEGLLHICGKVGSPLAARTAAVKAACHLMSAHGVQQQVKDAFKAAGGISIMVRLLPDQHLPLQAKAAAAGCIWHYLAPKPFISEISSSSEQAAAASDAVGDGAGSTMGCASPTSSPGDGVFGLPSPALLGRSPVTVSKPLAALEARSNLITAAKNMRKSSAVEQQQAGPSSTSGAPVDGGDGGGVAAAAAGSASARLPLSAAATAVSSITDGLAPAVKAAAPSAYTAAIAAWDNTIANGDLATRAEHVTAARCVPALMLLCCGPDGAPPAVVAAAEAAAAIARASSTDGSAATDGSRKSPSDSHDVSSTSTGTADGSSSISRGAGGAARGCPATDLDAIAEPSHGEMEDSDEVATAAAATGGNAGSQVDDSSSRGSSAAGGQQGGKKQKKAGKKKGGALEPGMAEAQIAASAALKLLAMSGDTGRAALSTAGVQQVLVQLLTGPTAAARWNARQVLVLLSLGPIDKRSKEARNRGCKQHPADINSADILGGRSRVVSASADNAAEAETAAAAAAVPAYISMVNLPASHWQRTAPLQMPALPPLPMIPGRRTAGGSEPQQNAGAAAAGGSVGGAGAVGAGSSAGMRPGSQQRRMSLTSAVGAVMMGSRMSNSMLVDSGGAGGDAAVGLSKLGTVARLSSGVPPGGSSGMISAVGSVSGATGV